MATLQKFKLLATRCAPVAGNPTQSPTTSPVVHLRRRKTLRMLLSRPSDHHRVLRRIPRCDGEEKKEKDRPEKKVRRKLKDLFVSSPPQPSSDEEEVEKKKENDSARLGSARLGVIRPVTARFRYRLLRRAWRPVLVTIPE